MAQSPRRGRPRVDPTTRTRALRTRPGSSPRGRNRTSGEEGDRCPLAQLDPLLASGSMPVSKWEPLIKQCLCCERSPSGNGEQAVIFTEYTDSANWIVRRLEEDASLRADTPAATTPQRGIRLEPSSWRSIPDHRLDRRWERRHRPASCTRTGQLRHRGPCPLGAAHGRIHRWARHVTSSFTTSSPRALARVSAQRPLDNFVRAANELSGRCSTHCRLWPNSPDWRRSD